MKLIYSPLMVFIKYYLCFSFFSQGSNGVQGERGETGPRVNYYYGKTRFIRDSRARDASTIIKIFCY